MQAIEIIWLELDLDAARLRAGRAWLSPRERERADRYLQPVHGARYIAAHAQLRWLLGQRLGSAPEAVGFERGPQGKPKIAGAPLQFNLSHSGARAVVALHSSIELGVDVESPATRRNWLGLAHRFFTAGEAAGLQALPEAQMAEQFCRLWTCKEAWMKADGRGLAAGVATAEVCLDGGRALLQAPAPDGGGRWW
ncbi:MAG: 4'-phosphopantetheinyl transferase family protein, partial [Terriglobales bacterium]